MSAYILRPSHLTFYADGDERPARPQCSRARAAPHGARHRLTPWRSLSAARRPVRWSKKRLSLREFARIRSKPSNSDGFWNTPPLCRPDAAKPRRILDHSAHCRHAHARDPVYTTLIAPQSRSSRSTPFAGRTTACRRPRASSSSPRRAQGQHRVDGRPPTRAPPSRRGGRCRFPSKDTPQLNPGGTGSPVL